MDLLALTQSRLLSSPLPIFHGPVPYTKGASFESFEAAKDAFLRHTVTRGLSYKVLRSDKSRSRYLASCRSSSCPFRIRRREEDERDRRENAQFLQQYEDEREIRLGAYAREHRGIPRLEDDRGEGLEPFVNRLLPATARARDARDRVRFAEDSDEESESASAVSEG